MFWHTFGLHQVEKMRLQKGKMPQKMRSLCNYRREKCHRSCVPFTTNLKNKLNITVKLQAVRYIVFVPTQVLLNFLPTVSPHLRSILFLYNTVEIVYCCWAHDVTRSHMNGISLYIVHEPWEMPAHSNCKHTQTATLPGRLRSCHTASTHTRSFLLLELHIKSERADISLLFDENEEIILWRLRGPGREADHPPASNVEAKNEWRCTYTPPYDFISCTGTILHLWQLV